MIGDGLGDAAEDGLPFGICGLFVTELLLLVPQLFEFVFERLNLLGRRLRLFLGCIRRRGVFNLSGLRSFQGSQLGDFGVELLLQ